MKDEVSLKDLKLDFRELLKIDFSKEKDCYKYEELIVGGQFKLIITIDNENNIVSDCLEVATGEKLMPYYVSSVCGDFIGKIRTEYEKKLEEIKDKCCSKCVFKSEYAKQVINYVRDKYQDELEYLWEKFPNNAVWRNKDNKKRYGALLVVEKEKLGIKEEGTVEIIDLLLETEKISELVDAKRYFVGYHMNKKHWITIKLDGSVELKKIYDLIDNSYNLAKIK